MNEVSKAFIRLAVVAILAINAVLTAKGMNPIPFDETAFTEWATYLVSGVLTLWCGWWKNNNVTKAAQKAQVQLQAIKQDRDGSDGAVFGTVDDSEVE